MRPWHRAPLHIRSYNVAGLSDLAWCRAAECDCSNGRKSFPMGLETAGFLGTQI